MKTIYHLRKGFDMTKQREEYGIKHDYSGLGYIADVISSVLIVKDINQIGCAAPPRSSFPR